MPEQYYRCEDYSPRNSVGYYVRLAAKLITAEFETRFVEQDVNFLQWTILIHLREGLARTSAELCQSIMHDSGALTRVIDQLEERGLLVRERSTQDRRIVALELTDKGRHTVDSLLPLIIDFYNASLADFSAEEADLLVRLLQKFTHGVSRERLRGAA